MRTFPRTIPRRDAARATGTHEKTIAASLNLPFDKSSKIVSLSKLAKAMQSDPVWIMDCLEGRDSALSTISVRAILDHYAHVKPRARLRKGLRYSARDLGLFRESVSPLAGHPTSNRPELGGNSMED